MTKAGPGEETEEDKNKKKIEAGAAKLDALSIKGVTGADLMAKAGDIDAQVKFADALTAEESAELKAITE